MADVCTVTGTLYNMDGTPAVGKALYIVKVLTDDEAVTPDPVRIFADPVTAQISFTVIRNSTAWLEGSVQQFNEDGGVAVTVPDAPTATLTSLLPATSAPSTAVTQATFNAHVATVAAPGVLGHVRGGGTGYTIDPDGTLQVPVVSAEVVEDYLATFFNPTVSALHFTYNDALNRVDVGIDNATASVDGLMSAADKTYLNSVPALLSGEASARAAADAALLSGINANSATIAALTTTGVAEGTNLYFTNARAITAVGLNAAGVAGGQTITGGTGAGENLTLQSTTNGTKGYLLLGTGGLVGINKATPGAQLHVNAKDATTLGFIVQMAASPNTTTGIPFQVWDSTGATKFKVDTGGNITASGNITAAGTSNLGIGLYTSSGGLGYHSGKLTLLSTGGVYFSSTSSIDGTQDLSLTHNAANTLQVGDGGANANGSLLLTALTASGLVRINKAGQTLFINGGSTGSVYAQMQNTGGSFYAGIDSSAGGSLFTNALPYASSFGTSNATALHLATNNVVRTTVDILGNIGVGTTTPLGKLHVAQGTAGVGTVSVTAGSGTITGVGTQFTNTFKIGDTITFTTASGSETKAITAIASDTAMTTAAFTGAASGVAYTLVGGDTLVAYGNGNVALSRGQLLAPNGTAALPSYSFTGNTSTGIYVPVAGQFGIAAGGSLVGIFRNVGLMLPADALGIYFGASSDTVLQRDAPNTLALRNGTNAQTFRLYQSYTDASNNSYFSFAYSGGAFRFGQTFAGTGSAQDIYFLSQGNLYLGASNTAAWRFSNGGGHLLATTDNTYDIGASGATRPRNVYVAGTGTFGGNLIANAFLAGGIATAYDSSNDLKINSTGVVGWTSGTLAAAKDTGIVRQQAKVVEINNGTAGQPGVLLLRGQTFASLPGVPVAGMRATVTDSTTTVSGATITGGGANTVPAFYDGANWVVR
jgi:hypothetical protein